MAGESSDRQNLKLIEDIKAGRAEPCALPSQLLRRITDDFSQNRELGRGGYGVVYKVKQIGLISFLIFQKEGICICMSILTNGFE